MRRVYKNNSSIHHEVISQNGFRVTSSVFTPGIKASVKLVTQRFVWPSIKADCQKWARGCIACQKSKVSRHVSSPAGTFAPPSRRFEHIHIDLVGPLPSSQGYKYCLTCIDRHSHWPEAFPVDDIQALTIAKTLFSGWISRFGTPLRITTDQGRQFESQLFKEMNTLLGTRHFRTTAHHPASNGLIERFHRPLKAAIRCHATEQWTEVLPTILLGFRSAWREDFQGTAEMIYGETLRLPGEFLAFRVSTPHIQEQSEFVKEMRRVFKQLRPAPDSRHGTKKIFVFKDLGTTQYVFVRREGSKAALQMPYDGPYAVIKRGDKMFDVDLHRRKTTISIDRLKPAYIIRLVLRPSHYPPRRSDACK